MRLQSDWGLFSDQPIYPVPDYPLYRTPYRKRRLAELLRLNPVYRGEHGLRSLKELVRSYLTITKDLGRVMTCVTQIEIG